jgi:hypothetical protein
MRSSPRWIPASRSLLVPALFALLLSTAFAVWVIAGVSGLAYALLFVAVCAPGLPLGFALFGRGHGAGWIAGMLLGYATISLAWWAVVFTGHPSTLAFAAAWAIAALGAWAFAQRFEAPFVVLPQWTARDTTALVLLLLMVPALVTRPFTRLGSSDAAGNQQYRAYFIADFFWHTAVAAELAKQEPVPRNPFLASETLHYYWTYFRVPATIAVTTGIDIQQALKLNAVSMSILFVAAIYLAAWCALPRWPFATALAVALTFVGPSAEGLAAIADLVRRGQPLSGLRDLNIDAVAAWAFKGLRIDDLPRAMWYTPHHASSYALGLLVVPIAISGGIRARAAAIFMAGCALGASVALNPLVGSVFCGVYGLAISFDLLNGRGSVRDFLRHVLAVVPVVVAFAWCTFSELGQGAGVALLHFGFWGPARNATALNVALQFGPILVPMAIGLWPTAAVPFRVVWPALAGVILALLLMHLVTLTSDQAWVGFRGGHIFFVLAPAIVGRGLVALWQAGRKPMAIALVCFVLAAGAPTTIIDAYNIQDVGNRGFAPRNEFHWTVLVTPDEQEALEWIRTRTPKNAVVQIEPTIRGRETWSLIPTFAQRRMATGMALALLPLPGYEERNETVKQIYASEDARLAWHEARSLGIDYLYVDATERAAYPAVAKFDHYPAYFTPVFRNAEAAVYALQPTAAMSEVQ